VYIGLYCLKNKLGSVSVDVPIDVPDFVPGNFLFVSSVVVCVPVVLGGGLLGVSVIVCVFVILEGGLLGVAIDVCGGGFGFL